MDALRGNSAVKKFRKLFHSKKNSFWTQKRTLLLRVEDTIIHTVVWSVDLIRGIFYGFADLVPNAWSLLYLALFGAGLVLLRDAFLSAIPLMLKSVSVWRDLINTIITVIDGIIDLCRLGFDLIDTVIQAIEHVLLMKKHPHKFNGFHDTKPILRYVSDHQLKKFFNRVENTCKSYNGISEIWNRVVKESLSPSVCPVIRATYPLGPKTIYPATNAVLGWMSYDACPYPKNNCESHAEAPDWVCVGTWTRIKPNPFIYSEKKTNSSPHAPLRPQPRFRSRSGLFRARNPSSHTYRRNLLATHNRPDPKVYWVGLQLGLLRSQISAQSSASCIPAHK